MRKFVEKCGGGDEDEEVVVVDDPRIRTRAMAMKTTTTTKKKKKFSVSVSPYNVYELRIRRLRSNSSVSSSARTETTAFEDISSISTSSSNFASSSSFSSCSSEFVKNCANITPEVVADLEVNSGAEMSSKFVECNKLAREVEARKLGEPKSDRLDGPPTKKSTVQIKSMTTPSESEIEDFFSSAEKDLHKRFSDKYNFDIVKDVPLEGRYEWVKITP